jgi:hypothetical protein
MDSSPKILLWNYSVEEMIELDRLFERVGAPEVKPVEKDQGDLPVHELLFTDNRCGTEFSCDERVMIFYNVPAPMIHTIMQETKGLEIPRPIFAVVTPQSIEWKFSELVDHLVKERDFIRKKAEEDKRRKSPLRKIEG